jgi:hypothetical protein
MRKRLKLAEQEKKAVARAIANINFIEMGGENVKVEWSPHALYDIEGVSIIDDRASITPRGTTFSPIRKGKKLSLWNLIREASYVWNDFDPVAAAIEQYEAMRGQKIVPDAIARAVSGQHYWIGVLEVVNTNILSNYKMLMYGNILEYGEGQNLTVFETDAFGHQVCDITYRCFMRYLEHGRNND